MPPPAALAGSFAETPARIRFIVAGIIRVTSGRVTPISTIQALALSIADAMKRRLATLFD